MTNTSKRPAIQPYQMRYSGPDIDGRTDSGAASYKSLDTAARNFLTAIRSRVWRAPDSTVTLTDKNTGQLLAEWAGCGISGSSGTLRVYTRELAGLLPPASEYSD